MTTALESKAGGARGWRGALRRLTLASISLLLSLVVCVALFELAMHALGRSATMLYQDDAAIGYYPAPGQDFVYMGCRVQTNRYGMRAPEYADRKPEGVFRIFLIGDSTLWGGEGVDQSELYARRLEDLLNQTSQAASGPRFEVWNIGVNAWGPYHKLAYVERFGVFDADLAVVCMPLGDLKRTGYGMRSLPFWSVHRPPRLVLERVVHTLAWIWAGQRLRHSSQQGVPEQEAKGTQTYLQLAELLRNDGRNVVFAILPTQATALGDKPTPDESRQDARLRPALEAAGFPYDFPVGLFRGRGGPGEFYVDGAHLSPQGHEAYAAYLYETLPKLSPALARALSAASPDQSRPPAD